jgi:hypothetical protein
MSNSLKFWYDSCLFNASLDWHCKRIANNDACYPHYWKLRKQQEVELGIGKTKLYTQCLFEFGTDNPYNGTWIDKFAQWNKVRSQLCSLKMSTETEQSTRGWKRRRTGSKFGWLRCWRRKWDGWAAGEWHVDDGGGINNWGEANAEPSKEEDEAEKQEWQGNLS